MKKKVKKLKNLTKLGAVAGAASLMAVALIPAGAVAEETTVVNYRTWTLNYTYGDGTPIVGATFGITCEGPSGGDTSTNTADKVFGNYNNKVAVTGATDANGVLVFENISDAETDCKVTLITSPCKEDSFEETEAFFVSDNPVTKVPSTCQVDPAAPPAPPAQPVEPPVVPPAEPEKPAQPEEPAKPVVPAKPEEAKPVVPAKPEEAKPEMPAKPKDPAKPAPKQAMLPNTGATAGVLGITALFLGGAGAAMIRRRNG